MVKHSQAPASRLNAGEIPTLLELYENPERKQNAVGVILDVTRTYKTNSSYDFITRVKLIDQSFNPTVVKYRHNKKYIHVFIFTRYVDEAPVFHRVGDILYLQSFDFEHYTDDGNEVKAKKKSHSKFMIFDGSPACRDYHLLNPSKREVFASDKAIQREIDRLREFNRNFFAQNSLTDLKWFGKLTINFSQCDTGDTDLILRLVDKTDVLPNNVITYTLQDARGQKFYLQLEPRQKLDRGDLLKVRSICKIATNGRMHANFYTSILKIPPFFYDAQHKDIFKYEIIREDQLADGYKSDEGEFDLEAENYSTFLG